MQTFAVSICPCMSNIKVFLHSIPTILTFISKIIENLPRSTIHVETNYWKILHPKHRINKIKNLFDIKKKKFPNSISIDAKATINHSELVIINFLRCNEIHIYFFIEFLNTLRKNETSYPSREAKQNYAT